MGFKGASDATIEVIAGRVQFAIVGLASSLPFIQDGKLVAVAVGMPQRSPLLPDVPTIAETLPGYARDGSHSLLAPAGTPLAVRQQLAKEVAPHLRAARHQGAPEELRLYSPTDRRPRSTSG